MRQVNVDKSASVVRDYSYYLYNSFQTQQSSEPTELYN